MAADRRPLWTVEWRLPDVVLRAQQPLPAEVAIAAPKLADFYNDPYNQRLLTNTVDMNAAEVVAHYEEQAAAGTAAFLLTCDDALVGDADLRSIADGVAETAILIGDRARQGQGLGKRFGILLHAFAFVTLRLTRTFAAIIPDNAASLRLFARLGYRVDPSLAARRFADDPSDVTLGLDGTAFLHTHAQELAQLTFQERRSSL